MKDIIMKCLFSVVSLVLLFGVAPPVAHAAEPDYESLSVPELTRRATAGDASAQFYLGIRYANGQGVPQDVRQAVNWTRKAVDDCSGKCPSVKGAEPRQSLDLMHDIVYKMKYACSIL